MDDGRVVVVTGASSGIGAALAGALAKRGHRVVGTSRSGAGGPPGILMLPLDVRDDASVRALVEEVVARAGRVDVLVNNAGEMLFGPVEEVGLARARGLFETNFWGVARMVAAVLGPMREARRGHIVNVGSVAGSVAIPLNGFYAATKHALAGYTEALRHEVMHLGVRVTLVEPGDAKTSLWREGAIAASTIGDYAGLRGRVLGSVQRLAAGAPPAEALAEEIARVVSSAGPASASASPASSPEHPSARVPSGRGRGLRDGRFARGRP
jgi:short-subunit dehydrogenase